MKTILWDFNGTVLNDVEISFDAANTILRRFDKPLLANLNAYRAAFGFPIIDYYTRLGLGGEIFKDAAPQWMEEYLRLEPACGLQEGAREALTAFRAAGYRQVILSASKRETLTQQMARLGILSYFDEILGLDHIYATSKEGIGKAWMARAQTDPTLCVMLGDTTHDFEVARALGVRCILVEGGHQLPETLAATGCEVAKDLFAAANMILK